MPADAANLGLVQDSVLRLDAAELARLTSHGFAIGRSIEFPSFALGYHTIYLADLPVYM